MTIDKLIALERKNPANSNGTDIAESVNKLIDSNTAGRLTTLGLIGSTAIYDASTKIDTTGFTTSGDGGSGSWIQNGATGQTPRQSPAQLGDALLNDGSGNQWAIVDDNVNIAALGGLTGDIEPFLSAAANSGLSSVTVSNSVTCSLLQTSAQSILKYINNIKVDGFLSFTLDDVEIDLTDFIDVNNESATKMDFQGVDSSNLDITGFSGVTGVAKNYLVTLDVTSAATVEVGHYLLFNVSSITGTGRFKEIIGCWKITAKTATSVTFKHTHHQSSFPTMTVTGGTMRPLKSVLRWQNGSRGLAIYNCDLNTVRNIAIAGSFDISVDSPSDGPDDGLQVGTQSNTSDTGSTQSRSVFTGSVFLNRVAVIEWPSNGLQCIGGSVMANGYSSCSNGHRGSQSAGNGFVNSKFSSSCGNATSGFEAEAGAVYNAAGSVSAGNGEQGVYTIGNGYAVFNSGSYSGGNLTHGLESKDGGTISANTSESTGNTITAINCNGRGFITLESGVVNGDISAAMSSSIELNSSIVSANYTVDSSSHIHLPDGTDFEKSFTTFPVLPVMNNGTYTDDGTIAEYAMSGNTLHWKIRLNYSGLSLDNNTFTLVNFPKPMAGRDGGAQLNIRSTTGLVYLATDTFQANYNSSSDAVVLVDMAGTLAKYNDGKFQSSGVIELSGWYEPE